MALTQSMKAALVLLLAMMMVVMASAMRNGGGSSGKVVVRSSTSSSSFSSHSYIQQLHEQLAIDISDPREDIRTNRVLNMEGF